MGGATRRGAAKVGTARQAHADEVALFVWARPIVLVYCGAQCLLYAALAFLFPQTLRPACVVIGGHGFLLFARVALADQRDQSRARELWSLCWVLTYAFVDFGLWVTNSRRRLIVGLSSGGMVCIAGLAALQGVYMRAIGIPPRARLCATACSVTLFLCLPEPWSEIGQPYEALLMVAAHLAGELSVSDVSTLLAARPAADRQPAGGERKKRL